MKKWLSLICIIALVLTMLPASALPANAAEGGKCGDNLTWERTISSKIVISGTGPMYDYSEEKPAPWASFADKLIYVIFPDGITTIGSYAFKDMKRISETIVPESVESIGKMAFAETRGALNFPGEAPEIAEDAFTNTTMQITTVLAWGEAEKKNYGGEITWRMADISLELSQSKRLVALNEEFKPEDMAFKMQYHGNGEETDYVPKQFSFGDYDNSTYGQKSVTVFADGRTFNLDYFVTDGTNHLELIEVRFPDIPSYANRLLRSEPIVTMGTLELEKFEHYSVIYDESSSVGIGGNVTIQGKGICEGFEKTFYYPILKTDVSNADVSLNGYNEFNGEPIVPTVSVETQYGRLPEKDYYVFYENNVNIGTAIVRTIGIGNGYGERRRELPITTYDVSRRLSGNYIGMVDGELSDDIYYDQMIMSPATLDVEIAYSGQHIAAYALYKVEEDGLTLVDEKITDVGFFVQNGYEYDFSSVYEDDAEVGGAVYLLSYSWVSEKGEVYAGVLYVIIPAKVGKATSITFHHIENDGDFRKEYFSVSGDDGVLGEVIWTSSDTSVAVVEGGTVTMKKPGTVMITAQCGDWSQSYEITETTQDLTQGFIFDYSEETGTARVIHDGRLLTEGTEYILSVEKNEGAVTVTATGCGFFTGELVKTFDGLDSLADPHTHSFTNSCDGTCNGCDFTRENDHNFSQSWSKDETHHWHVCLACGEKAEYTEHSLLSEEECSVCGALCSPGDVNGDDKVNSLDGLMLMRYLNGWGVEIAFPDAMDVNGDGKVNSLDGLILMRYLNGWNVSIG